MSKARSPRELLCHTPGLWTAPATYPSSEFPGTGNVRGLFYDTLPWKGKPTRSFAWLGLPESASKEKPVPGVVLVHGGHGCAFEAWAKLWVDRGYAAIAMDTCGSLPTGESNAHPSHPEGGPRGWGGFDQGDWPMQDQWMYHAVADVILAHSLLRSLPQVDSARIGMTGISWGGVIACNVTGIDTRFACNVPVYGCGYLHEASCFAEYIRNAGPNWAAWWDPSQYLSHSQCPTLWVTGTNDFAFPLHSLRRSRELLGDKAQIAVRLRMPHGHGEAGENPEEIHGFINQHLKGGSTYPALHLLPVSQGMARAGYQHAIGNVHAELFYTCDSGNWPDRNWEVLPAHVDTATSTISSRIPDNTVAWFLNLQDSRKWVVSTDVQFNMQSDLSSSVVPDSRE